VTGTITLRMDSDPAAEVPSGAVVNLLRVSSATGPDAPSEALRIDFSLTPEQGLHGREIRLMPGRWLIEATLGSGDVVSELVEIGEGDSVSVVLPLPDKSPHEWLGWQYSNGNVEGQAALDQLLGQAKDIALKADEKYRIVVRARLLSRRLTASAKSGAAKLALGLNSLRGQFDPDGRVSQVILSVQNELNRRAASDTAPVVRIEQCRQPDGSAVDRWSPFLSKADEAGLVIEPFRPSPQEKVYLYRPSEEHEEASRRFVDVEWDGERYKLSLPEPWLSISASQRTGSELLVRKHPLDGSLRASLAVLDPDFSTISAMMMTSAMPKAAVLVNENADRIFADRSLAAAAASYVILSSGQADLRMLRLMRQFEEGNPAPDARMIAAWRMLRFPEEGQGSVRPAIIDAFLAGPPYFSIGIGWLLDALTMLGPEDSQATAYAEVVKQVAIRLDTSQVFTTVKQAIGER
jgi:hypothetical protein